MSLFKGRRSSVIAAIVLAAMALTACSEVQQDTTIGTVVGAGLGYVVGHQMGREIEGAVIGGVIGGALGYYIGKSRTEKVASADQAATSHSYKAVQGLQVKIDAATVSPEYVYPGDSLNLNATVSVLSPNPTDNVNLTQRIAIYRGDQLIGNIVEDNFAVTPGTTRLSRQITLQKGMPAGKYTFVTHVKATNGTDVADDDAQKTFTVS